MDRVYVTYDLKPGVTRDQYREFSENFDQTITVHLPGVIRFEVHIVDGAATGVNGTRLDRPPFHVIECIDVANWDAWMRVVASDAMAPVRDAFEKIVDPDSVVMVWGKNV